MAGGIGTNARSTAGAESGNPAVKKRHILPNSTLGNGTAPSPKTKTADNPADFMDEQFDED
jgi:hypothetical protein